MVFRVACVFVLAGASTLLRAEEPSKLQGAGLGVVAFSNDCSPVAKAPFNHAVALLHSFEFAAARAAFQGALEADPSCAMALWGVALCHWGNPFAAAARPAPALKEGLDSVRKAAATGTPTDREREYIRAASRLFEDYDKVDQRIRILAYEGAMASLAARYPDDHEASIFYALALAAAADPLDKTYAKQLKAGAILESLWEAQPDHPGIAHYIIHAYDVPPLAHRALRAAELYATIAPDAPHALHMPSHTFTRLGLWQESIEANLAAGAAARHNGSVAEELHSMDYRAYAYLQTGQDSAARELVESLPAVAARFDPSAMGSAAPGVAGSFALAAIPARYALERGAWKEARNLEVRAGGVPYADSLTLFARALGAARTGDKVGARTAIEGLGKLREKLSSAGESYWCEQVRIQELAASAWLAHAEGRADEALVTLRSASEAEDLTEKNAVTPGPIAPVRELLGEMLLERGESAEALREFEKTLQREPKRYRSLAGAMHAASLSGDPKAARAFARELTTNCTRADQPARPDLDEARRLATGG